MSDPTSHLDFIEGKQHGWTNAVAVETMGAQASMEPPSSNSSYQAGWAEGKALHANGQGPDGSQIPKYPS